MMKIGEVKRILKVLGMRSINLAQSLEVADVIVDKGVKIHGLVGSGKARIGGKTTSSAVAGFYGDLWTDQIIGLSADQLIDQWLD